MSYATIEELCVFGQSHKVENNKIYRQLSSNIRSLSSNSPSVNQKKSSNCFCQPQMLSHALQVKYYSKNYPQRPFFVKNRKTIDSWNHHKNSISNPVILPNGFKNLLRAKSTVIKQKKLQQFYINREGRESNIEQKSLKTSSSNLFQPNFPAKKQRKSRRSSLCFDKFTKINETIEIPFENISYQTKTVTVHSLTQDLNEFILRQKNGQYNTINTIKKQSEQNSNLFKRQKIKKMRNLKKQKQNIEFDLQPWGQHEHQDVFF